MSNSIPVITFSLSLLMRMEVIKLRSSSGMAKTAGITLCLAGALVIALYGSRSLSPLRLRLVFAGSKPRVSQSARGLGESPRTTQSLPANPPMHVHNDAGVAAAATCRRPSSGAKPAKADVSTESFPT
ncbi:unnamed protein product [Urochloa humidicola]